LPVFEEPSLLELLLDFVPQAASNPAAPADPARARNARRAWRFWRNR
jgi:hypothetical protein